MVNEALIFIPDISGFTKFITECNLNHSKQIIFNLIDIILESNQIGLELSEIEGDAVLFYLKGKAPERDVLVKQAEKTFIDFHHNLKEMGKNLFCGCKCGGCSTASNLTLKFIIHYGACKEVHYNGFRKLIGSDVILAHRLLKSTVSEREYILFSENYLKLHRPENETEKRWIDYKPHIENIKNFGEIKSEFISLSPLREILEQ